MTNNPFFSSFYSSPTSSITACAAASIRATAPSTCRLKAVRKSLVASIKLGLLVPLLRLLVFSAVWNVVLDHRSISLRTYQMKSVFFVRFLLALARVIASFVSLHHAYICRCRVCSGKVQESLFEIKRILLRVEFIVGSKKWTLK